MSNQEKLTAIIALRCYPEWKRELKREAQERGTSLSDLIYQCLEIGYEKIVEQRKKEGGV